MFWERFYSLCLEANTKPNPVAKELGYSTAICTKWKKGTSPNADALIKIADYFNVSVDYLIGLTDDKHHELPTINIDEIDNLKELPKDGAKISLKVIGPLESIKKVEDAIKNLGSRYYMDELEEVNSTDSEIIEPSNISSMRNPITYGTKIKVLGKVPAGVPIEAVECVIDEIDISKEMADDDHEYLGLLVSGDSMFPEYLDGDIVIIRKQPTAETGDDVVAYVNGYDATLKRLQRMSNGIRLKALNPQYESKFYSNDEIEKLPVSILGVVVEMRRTKK